MFKSMLGKSNPLTQLRPPWDTWTEALGNLGRKVFFFLFRVFEKHDFPLRAQESDPFPIFPALGSLPLAGS